MFVLATLKKIKQYLNIKKRKRPKFLQKMLLCKPCLAEGLPSWKASFLHLSGASPLKSDWSQLGVSLKCYARAPQGLAQLQLRLWSPLCIVFLVHFPLGGHCLFIFEAQEGSSVPSLGLQGWRRVFKSFHAPLELCVPHQDCIHKLSFSFSPFFFFLLPENMFLVLSEVAKAPGRDSSHAVCSLTIWIAFPLKRWLSDKRRDRQIGRTLAFSPSHASKITVEVFKNWGKSWHLPSAGTVLHTHTNL